MGRPKKFSREEVLEKAVPLFWERGFADTGLQDLEKATGVNKSGLYSEFRDKDDLFTASLQHYFDTFTSSSLLKVSPLGWANIDAFFQAVSRGCSRDQKGCFGVSASREMKLLPAEAHDVLSRSRSNLKKMFVANVAAEKTKLPPEAVADVLHTFFQGLCIEQNANVTRASQLKRIEDFLHVVRLM